MKKIDESDKLCIYLDQFVISDLLEEKNPLWIEIKQLLQMNLSLGKIYCPISVEHILETSKKNLADAKAHDIYYRRFSDGYIFKTEPFLTAQLISSLIRKNKKTKTTKVKETEGVKMIYLDQILMLIILEKASLTGTMKMKMLFQNSLDQNYHGI